MHCSKPVQLRHQAASFQILQNFCSFCVIHTGTGFGEIWVTFTHYCVTCGSCTGKKVEPDILQLEPAVLYVVCDRGNVAALEQFTHTTLFGLERFHNRLQAKSLWQLIQTCCYTKSFVNRPSVLKSVAHGNRRTASTLELCRVTHGERSISHNRRAKRYLQTKIRRRGFYWRSSLNRRGWFYRRSRTT